MGLFSRDDAPNGNGRAAHIRSMRSARTERRARRPETQTDALPLDPALAEKQRARRRLIGAIALVLAAIIVLPMVLDSHPKPVTGDILIDIPNHSPDLAADGEAKSPDGLGGFVAFPDSASLPTFSSSSVVTDKPNTPHLVSSMAREPIVKPLQPTTKPVVSSPAIAPLLASNSRGAPGAPGVPGVRFALRLGSFADDAVALDWVSKLKTVGVPAYTERLKQADGSIHTLLNAGPFANRAAASAAIARVRAAGLIAPNDAAQ